MDNFKIIYRILKYLEQSMDCEMPDFEFISAARLNISNERWERLLFMLADSRYIEGVTFVQGVGDTRPMLCKPVAPRITLKGLEYLAENSLMQKAYNLMKGIKDITPGM